MENIIDKPSTKSINCYLPLKKQPHYLSFLIMFLMLNNCFMVSVKTFTISKPDRLAFSRLLTNSLAMHKTNNTCKGVSGIIFSCKTISLKCNRWDNTTTTKISCKYTNNFTKPRSKRLLETQYRRPFRRFLRSNLIGFLRSSTTLAIMPVR